MQILNGLWEDCLSANTRKPKQGSEYLGLFKSLNEKRTRIEAELSNEGRQALDTFERTFQTLADLREEDTCIRSFRLGAKVMADILGEYHGQFEN